ncbi:hypothetical protein HDU97_006851 [Phlyctochytrium planicorne]|nr:hypothetical protein HDU97_006851 [Phlyctochytrium planicorne]
MHHRILPIHTLTLAHPLPVLSFLIKTLSSIKGSEGNQFGLVGQLLVFADRIRKGSNVDILPFFALVVSDDAEAGDLNGLEDVDVWGILWLHRPRVQFWFRGGPGEDGSLQRSLVKDVLGKAFKMVEHVNVSGMDDDEKIKSGEVFLYCLDMRYAEIVEGMVGRVGWRQYGYEIHFIPEEVKGLGNAKKVGDVWKDEATGEMYEMDTICADDYDQIVEYSTVKYPKKYLTLLITEEPFVTLSRVIRRHGAPKKGSMIAWVFTHISLSGALLSTINTHRRRGLASICMESSWSNHVNWVNKMEDVVGIGLGWLRPYGLVASTNTASLQLVKESGYLKLDCADRGWCGVGIDNGDERVVSDGKNAELVLARL